MLPCVGLAMPDMTLANVLLPEPDTPIMPTKLPECDSNDKSWMPMVLLLKL